MPTSRTIVFFLMISCLSLAGCGGGANPANPASPLVGITVSPDTTITTNEYGQTATVSISLGSIPAADVTIPVSSTDTTEGTVDKTSLVFTRTDWATPQTITVTGVNDTGADGDQSYSIRLGPAISAPSSSYNSMEKLIPAVNRDVIDGSFVVSAISGNTSESGTTATFTVRLGSAPIANVTIPVESSNTAEGTVNPNSLLFTPSDWNLDQTVTVTGVGDTASGDQAYDIQLDPVSSTDPKYSGLDPADVPVINLNVKRGSVIVTPTSGYTDESGKTASFAIHLNMAPAANVNIPISSSSLSEGTITIPLPPSSLVFTSANYNSDQTVTVAGEDDATADGNQNYSITLGSTTSTDDNFDGLNTVVSMTNVDLVDPYGVIPRISAGAYHNLALASDGSVWGWGKCAEGQLDDGVVPATCSGTYILPQRLNITKASAISAGTDFSAIVKADGTVWTSGINDAIACQLGHAGGGAGSPLAQVDGLTGITTVSAGGYHTLAIKNDGTVWAWGQGLSGQLGNGLQTFSQTPVQAIEDLTGKIVTAIATGDSHSLALDDMGNVYTWGSDYYSQRGIGSNKQDTAYPTFITPFNSVTAIGAGQLHAFAVGIYSNTSASVDTYGWGYNNASQLGIGSSTPDPFYKSLPTAANIFSNTVVPTRIDGGYQHSIALVGTTVYAWGDNDDLLVAGGENWDNRGALGKGNTTDYAAPTTAFTTSGPATDVGAGSNFSLVLLSDGRIHTSGVNNYSQLGTNAVNSGPGFYTTSPVSVEDPSDTMSFYAYRPILSGQPATSSPSTTASIAVCWDTATNSALPNCGPITQYKYKTDSTAWSGPIPINTPISLTSSTLISGNPVTLWVVGINAGGTEMQTDTSAVKVSWTVD